MTKILFVCHGSICRSPMAEFIFGDLVKKANLEASFQIESAAVSREELGNPVYPPARRVLAAHGIFCGSHRARQITKGDYAAFDYLIGMDRENLSGMRRVFGADPEGKLRLLLSFAGKTAMWQTRGIPMILKRPTAILTKAAAHCWLFCSGKTEPAQKSRLQLHKSARTQKRPG